MYALVHAGYGNLTPRTVPGKLVTILYAIIGIPLFLLYLTNIGGILAKSFKWTYARLCKCQICLHYFGRRRRRKRRKHDNADSTDLETDDESDDENEEQDLDSVTVPISLCLTIMVSFIVGGATLFSEWESWDLLEGSYFCFISLSTIGFGDYVPGDSIQSESGEIQLSFIFCSMYLMLGMALIAMCFNLMQEEVVASIRAMGKRCGLVKDEEDVDVDDVLAENEVGYEEDGMEMQEFYEREPTPVDGSEFRRQNDVAMGRAASETSGTSRSSSQASGVTMRRRRSEEDDYR